MPRDAFNDFLEMLPSSQNLDPALYKEFQKLYIAIHRLRKEADRQADVLGTPVESQGSSRIVVGTSNVTCRGAQVNVTIS